MTETIATEFSEEQSELRDAVRRFARQEVQPMAARTDEESRFPEEIFEKMAALGFLGIPIPEEYGGVGADLLCYVLAVEELSYACASTTLSVAAHTSLSALPILLFGSEEQKKRFLPELAAGRVLGSFGLTEPNAGSDAGATRTTARRDGDGYVLNGTKIYITNASRAGIFVLTARTGRPEEGTHGITTFIVERDTPGFSVGQKEDKLGIRGSDTCQIHLSDCRIDAANRLGEEGEGFKNFMKTLDGGRIGIGAMGIGIGQAALDVAAEYARDRKAFGKPIGELGAIREKLADMETSIRASRLLVYDAARRRMRGLPHTREAAIAKLFASEAATRVAADAIQILGGNGYSREFPVERFYRDAKLLEIGEGTSEIQRLVIGKSVLKQRAL